MPSDDTKLSEYALGILSKDAREQIEAEVAVSTAAQGRLRGIEETLDIVAMAEPCLQPSSRLHERLLTSLDHSTRFEGYVDRLTNFLDLGVDRVRELLRTIDAAPGTPWEDSGVPGISVLPLDGGPRVAAAQCSLMIIEPGQAFPDHRHLGHEWGFILQGSVLEDSSRTFAPGDIVYKEPDSAHSFRVTGTEPFVFAVVVYEGIAWLSD